MAQSKKPSQIPANYKWRADIKRYSGPGGKKLTRSEFDNLKAQSIGLGNAYQFKKLKQSATYQHFANQAVENRGLSGKSVQSIDSEFTRLFVKAQKSRRRVDGTYARRGDMHRLLVWLKLRDKDAEYDVGDTP